MKYRKKSPNMKRSENNCNMKKFATLNYRSGFISIITT